MDGCSRSGSSFRASEGDGDLTDTLVDTQEKLEVLGAVFLLIPQQGVEDFVEPAGITTTAKTAPDTGHAPGHQQGTDRNLPEHGYGRRRLHGDTPSR